MSKPKSKPAVRGPVPLTLYALDKAFQETKKIATPHRTPNFRRLYELADPSTPLGGIMTYLEDNNTGYDGLLERWMLNFIDRTGQPFNFEADLLPSLIFPSPAKD